LPRTANLIKCVDCESGIQSKKEAYVHRFELKFEDPVKEDLQFGKVAYLCKKCLEKVVPIDNNG
jgi:hypothetical protein